MEVINRIKTKTSEIWIDDEGILLLKHMEGIELDLELTKDCFKAYDQLGIGPHHKVLQLIDVRNSSMTPEARAYSAENRKNYFIATAIISDSLAVRMIANFLNNFYKQTVPIKMFATEAEARKWLRTFRK